MLKDMILFYEFNYDPLNFHKIKNADLRNTNVVIEYRGYFGQNSWKEFLQSFTFSFRNLISDCQQSIDRDSYEGFILMYRDTLLDKQYIETDTNKIINIISSSNQ
jgi:hypothetical protein